MKSVKAPRGGPITFRFFLHCLLTALALPQCSAWPCDADVGFEEHAASTRVCRVREAVTQQRLATECPKGELSNIQTPHRFRSPQALGSNQACEGEGLETRDLRYKDGERYRELALFVYESLPARGIISGADRRQRLHCTTPV